MRETKDLMCSKVARYLIYPCAILIVFNYSYFMGLEGCFTEPFDMQY